MAQQATSANTSINSKRVPAIFQKVSFAPGMRVIDYGCGKYVDHIRDHMSRYEYLPFDPFNQPDDVNRATLEQCKDGKFGVVILSNVVNVIDDMSTVFDVINHCLQLANGGEVYIGIYEGDKSGIGKYTKSDCYQRNWTRHNWACWLAANGYELREYAAGLVISGKRQQLREL